MGLKKKKAKKIKRLQPVKQSSIMDSTFFSVFIGEYVEIIAKTGLTDKVPVIVQGYLLDIDDDFYYLADDGNSVSRALKRSELCVIEIAKTKTLFDEILENTPSALNKEEGN